MRLLLVLTLVSGCTHSTPTPVLSNRVEAKPEAPIKWVPATHPYWGDTCYRTGGVPRCEHHITPLGGWLDCYCRY